MLKLVHTREQLITELTNLCLNQLRLLNFLMQRLLETNQLSKLKSGQVQSHQLTNMYSIIAKILKLFGCQKLLQIFLAGHLSSAHLDLVQQMKLAKLKSSLKEQVKAQLHLTTEVKTAA